MKTIPMDHQTEALRLCEDKDHFAFFCEQGTGKTWMVLADAERYYNRGKLDALLVVAPKGVDANWVRVEIPLHLEVPHVARLYRSGAGKKATKALEDLFKPREEGEMPFLRILAINYDALNTDQGFKFVKRFLSATSAMTMLDESRRIKNSRSMRTKRVLSLRHLTPVRRIGTGTPVDGAPLDAFCQMQFLEPGLLGTNSYRAFVAEYADLMDEDSRLVRHIMETANNAYAKPQIVVRNEDGTPRYRNMEKLQALIAPHAYRVLKSECMNLPDKIYQMRFFDLAPNVRKLYNELDEDLRLTINGDMVLTAMRLTAMMKLQQITSGFVVVTKGEPMRLADETTGRLKLLQSVIEDLPEGTPFIVFARFREELRMITKLLDDMGISAVEYHGGTKDKARSVAVDDFQAHRARAFVSQPRCGGIGLTLTAAETVIYYSNSFDGEERNQSEDRAHRKGTTKHVVYIDLVATDTIDETIVRALQRKKNLAAAVMGDFARSKKTGHNKPLYSELEK